MPLAPSGGKALYPLIGVTKAGRSAPGYLLSKHNLTIHVGEKIDKHESLLYIVFVSDRMGGATSDFPFRKVSIIGHAGG